MATQRLFIATVAGDSAAVISNLFHVWHQSESVDPEAVDRFCVMLHDNRTSLPIVYFSEWMDRWLMGNDVQGPGNAQGRRFEASCFSRVEAMDWASRRGSQYQEQDWLTARLREAASAWDKLVDRVAIVLVREVLDGTTLDEEVQASLRVVPNWLQTGRV